MKLACITNPKTHPAFDTTIELYKRFAKDHRIDFFHIDQESIISSSGIKGQHIDSLESFDEFLALVDCNEKYSLQDFDLIFCRSDKPLPDAYYFKLATFEDKVSFVNRPSALLEVSRRTFLDKVAKDWMPEYIFTTSPDEAAEFIQVHEKVVFKSADSYGGKEIWRVFKLPSGSYEVQQSTNPPILVSDEKAASSHILKDAKLPYQVVRFLENVSRGDKRVLVVDGQIYGAILRQSATGDWINNLTAGGTATQVEVTDKERTTIESSCGEYHRRGVYTLGYDFLFDKDQWILSEINAGNIGGYNRLEQLSGKPVINNLIGWLLDFKNLHGLDSSNS